jgi:hypothetical protein
MRTRPTPAQGTDSATWSALTDTTRCHTLSVLWRTQRNSALPPSTRSSAACDEHERKLSCGGKGMGTASAQHVGSRTPHRAPGSGSGALAALFVLSHPRTASHHRGVAVGPSRPADLCRAIPRPLHCTQGRAAWWGGRRLTEIKTGPLLTVAHSKSHLRRRQDRWRGV